MPTKARAILIGLTSALLLAPGLSFGQREQTTVPAYDTLPDWSGAWSMVGGTVFDRATQTGQGGAISVGVRSHPPYNAEWEALYKTHLDRRDKNLFPDTISNCGIPAGFPRHFNLPDLYEFVVRPEQVWVLTENGPNVLRIYTDGRKHLEDQWETYTGDSVGHWEGDTLLFTTVALKGFRDKDVILDRTGLVLSDKSHATSRIRKVNPTTIEVQMTIEDPKALTKPWVVTKQFRKEPPGTRIYDYGCAENNRNPVDVKTGETLVLSPDGTPLNKD
jgi:hypothetical protein